MSTQFGTRILCFFVFLSFYTKGLTQQTQKTNRYLPKLHDQLGKLLAVEKQMRKAAAQREKERRSAVARSRGLPDVGSV